MRNEQGATLTEVLVILALLATLILISIPSLVDLLRSFELRGASSSLANGFRRAQALAVRDHRNYLLVVNPQYSTGSPQFCWEPPAAPRLFAVVEDGGKDCQIDCAGGTDRLVEWGPQIPTGVSWVGVPSSVEPYGIGGAVGTARYKTICYTSRGYVSPLTQAGSVYLGNTYKQMYRRVDALLTGRVEVKRYRNGQYED